MNGNPEMMPNAESVEALRRSLEIIQPLVAERRACWVCGGAYYHIPPCSLVLRVAADYAVQIDRDFMSMTEDPEAGGYLWPDGFGPPNVIEGEGSVT